MATIPVKKVAGADTIHARTYIWEALVAGSLDGEAIKVPDHADRSVHVVGNFDSATVVFQGSNDGANFVTLLDPQGTAISFTATGLKQILEITRFVRPLLSGGLGSENIDVFLHVRAQR